MANTNITVLEVAQIGHAWFIFRVDPTDTEFPDDAKLERIPGQMGTKRQMMKAARAIAATTGERVRLSGES
jgi:hypothetical protein